MGPAPSGAITSIQSKLVSRLSKEVTSLRAKHREYEETQKKYEGTIARLLEFKRQTHQRAAFSAFFGDPRASSSHASPP
ncbi:hypothetical protein Scep_014595 [Stephania cephalantha]|uniref:Uncharacterized protein n=1 Tax=Stephania cephalantha TaxID=152367 RepID=A0AAP0J1J2_9MAGN